MASPRGDQGLSVEGIGKNLFPLLQIKQQQSEGWDNFTHLAVLVVLLSWRRPSVMHCLSKPFGDSASTSLLLSPQPWKLFLLRLQLQEQGPCRTAVVKSPAGF